MISERLTRGASRVQDGGVQAFCVRGDISEGEVVGRGRYKMYVRFISYLITMFTSSNSIYRVLRRYVHPYHLPPATLRLVRHPFA